ncbi:hypothetical protein [Micromonospora sp. NPDC048898]|uniref:hypothetical protein n=1 Tax=Micromonospora sp. NPDC048898 TaxID=3364260 RepID=UPI00372271D3
MTRAKPSATAVIGALTAAILVATTGCAGQADMVTFVGFAKTDDPHGVFGQIRAELEQPAR